MNVCSLIIVSMILRRAIALFSRNRQVFGGLDSGERYKMYQNHSIFVDYVQSTDMCPVLMYPTNVHVMVLNLDLSIQRRKRMEQRFQELGLPPFERFPAILVNLSHTYDIPRLRVQPRNRLMRIADYGCALSHREAWKAIAQGSHEWVAVLEDDVVPVSREAMVSFDAIPDICGLYFLASNPLFSELLCANSNMHVLYAGYGSWGYLLNRSMAQKLVTLSSNGFDRSVDIWLYDYVWVCSTGRPNRAAHHATNRNDPKSIRNLINGDIKEHSDLVLS